MAIGRLGFDWESSRRLVLPSGLQTVMLEPRDPEFTRELGLLILDALWAVRYGTSSRVAARLAAIH
jgi:hypothetical protein